MNATRSLHDQQPLAPLALPEEDEEYQEHSDGDSRSEESSEDEYEEGAGSRPRPASASRSRGRSSSGSSAGAPARSLPPPGFTLKRFAIEDRIDEIIAFVLKHQRLPKAKGKEEEEDRLYKWLHKRKQAR
eukprot:tig00021094_g18104.t1